MPKSDTQFKKGQSGNPKGRPKVPDDVKAIKNLDRYETERLMNVFLNLTPSQLKEWIRSDRLTCKEQMIATVIDKAIFYGDQQRLGFFLDRLIGKVPDKMEIKMPTPLVIVRPNGDQVELTSRMIEQKENHENES